MKTKRLYPMFAVLLLMTAGAALAGEMPVQTQVTAPDPAAMALEVPAEPDPGVQLAPGAEIPEWLRDIDPKVTLSKAGGTYSWGGCQCYTNCSSRYSCICSHDGCCSGCCSAAFGALC
ncbi:MAG TPA: hypothetical protein VEL74_13960 [Thermoanaerobaculia bacterium]|nr:hypothetical protein [Thermoanaerobaculia bacterium]